MLALGDSGKGNVGLAFSLVWKEKWNKPLRKEQNKYVLRKIKLFFCRIVL